MKTTKDAIDAIASELQNLRKKYEMVVIVGRFCPMHVGHEAMIGGMIQAFPNKHIVLIGSCNERMSMRNLFNFNDRTSFIKAVFPDCRIAAMPDFPDDDNSWFTALDSILFLAGVNPQKVAFLGGCEEDVEWYYRFGRNVHIVNRFQGTTINVSGTEIRDHLISDNLEKLSKLVNPLMLELIRERFRDRWKEFRNR